MHPESHTSLNSRQNRYVTKELCLNSQYSWKSIGKKYPDDLLLLDSFWSVHIPWGHGKGFVNRPRDNDNMANVLRPNFIHTSHIHTIYIFTYFILFLQLWSNYLFIINTHIFMQPPCVQLHFLLQLRFLDLFQLFFFWRGGGGGNIVLNVTWNHQLMVNVHSFFFLWTLTFRPFPQLCFHNTFFISSWMWP